MRRRISGEVSVPPERTLLSGVRRADVVAAAILFRLRPIGPGQEELGGSLRLRTNFSPTVKNGLEPVGVQLI
jgi:hypothetical protein